MKLPIPVEYEPMEAQVAKEIPVGGGWIYEPKWDGFRCLVFRDGSEVDLRSKASKPLARYFPEVVEVIQRLRTPRFVLDGELVIPVEGAFLFDELLLRIHPAASRVKMLASTHPAHLVVFDLLVGESGVDLTGERLEERSRMLDDFAGRHLTHESLYRSPRTSDVELARRWLAGELGGLDGVIAKRSDLPYKSGERTGMKKIKRLRTAECVVGGFRWSSAGRTIGSLLLGLYGEDGHLHHVGFCSSLNAKVRREADARVIPLQGGEGFDGRAPGGPSRWRKKGTGDWEAVRPEVVVEVEYDHYSGGRFRHGTRFLRWRPDKAPRQCRMEQIEREAASAIEILEREISYGKQT